MLGAFLKIVHGIVMWLAVSAWPDVRPGLVAPAVVSAEVAATEHAPAELLLALAWGESRFESSAAPRCGVLQTWPPGMDEPWSACGQARGSLVAGFAAGARELEMLLDDRRVVGALRPALRYRACGNAAFRGACTRAQISWVEASLARCVRLGGCRARAWKSSASSPRSRA